MSKEEMSERCKNFIIVCLKFCETYYKYELNILSLDKFEKAKEIFYNEVQRFEGLK